MNTRKKSISLHALGVITTKPRGSHAHRSTSASSTGNTLPSDTHPAKRVKRSHTLCGSAPSPASTTSPKSPSRNGNATTVKDRRRSQPTAQVTPPPSPDDYPYNQIDKSKIEDDIVVAVIEQLEACGNRPHLIKDLATALETSLHSVQRYETCECAHIESLTDCSSSSNPGAIISSRLTNFLRRPWTDASPCPLAKEQVNIQPRRVYYFLTTCARQPIPATSSNPTLSGMRIISPSISSGPDDQERQEQAKDVEKGGHNERDILSPSPELDLTAPEFFTGHHSHSLSTVSFNEPSQYPDLYGSAYREAASPPLEHDEREFEQTANDMATRRAGEQGSTMDANSNLPSLEPGDEHIADGFLLMGDDVAASQALAGQEESEEVRHQRNHEAASSLFGGDYGRLTVALPNDLTLTSSPVMRPSIGTKNMPPPMTSLSSRNAEDDAAWYELKSPDCVELSEIDDLLG